MVDPLTPKQRRKAMQGNRGKNTRLELAVRRGLYARGFRYRLHGPKAIGSPDIVLRNFGAVVFIHGCFWHQHEGCRLAATVRDDANSRWAEKFRRNVERDRENIERAREAGYRVAIVWECAVEHKKTESEKREVSLDKLSEWLRDDSSNQALEIGQSSVGQSH